MQKHDAPPLASRTTQTAQTPAMLMSQASAHMHATQRDASCKISHLLATCSQSSSFMKQHSQIHPSPTFPSRSTKMADLRELGGLRTAADSACCMPWHVQHHPAMRPTLPLMQWHPQIYSSPLPNISVNPTSGVLHCLNSQILTCPVH